MAQRIDDTRKYQQMTIADADQLFQQLALKETAINKAKAVADKKIADIKSRLEDDVESLKADSSSLVKELAEYIKANKDRFIKPRQRTTTFGKYGLRTVTEIKITDEQAVIDYAKENNLPLYKVENKLDKKAIEKRLLDGNKVTGAIRIAGDVVHYTVTKLKDDKE